ncbi:uncharacterized protein LOC104886303 [Beta vulgaris subsp. vulgaris]|uniref:uncharacterized protein LOC104886303 n=1 Tax=Beta vulgaris subsp. vulgaris TaxID=3555 RepID=UPI0025478790|nr:uncharacterized protein LOC104886303 [Beta vulgaris subsp. vulgaris]
MREFTLALKEWIATPTEAIDTLFMQIDSFIAGQLTEIRNSLEASRRSHGTEFDILPYSALNGVCSQYCLELIQDEFGRIKAYDGDWSRCGCVVQNTHGIPCACHTFFAVQNGRLLYCQEVDPFWYRLAIGDGTDSAEILSERDQDRQFFMSLVTEVQARDPAIMRSVSRVLQLELYPDRRSFEEPEVNATSKGRGKLNKGLRRNKSGFEHVMGKSTSSGKSSAATGWRFDMERFPYFHRLPLTIQEHIEGWLDVVADGNCGFRCVADAFCSGQDNWDIVRRTTVSELHQNGPLFHWIYGDDLNEAITRITWEGERCGEEHYMEVLADLYPIANHYRCTIFFFGLNGLLICRLQFFQLMLEVGTLCHKES